MPFDDNRDDRSGPALPSVLLGAALGVFLVFPALVMAIASAGAGHGDYVLARALFPASMLLTLIEGNIGTLSMIVGLLQFPIYGGLLAWSLVRKVYLPMVVVGLLHLVAAIVCFSDAIPGFS
jgi:hypothetical protein